MRELVDQIERVLGESREREEVHEAALNAASLLEKATLSVSGNMGWSAEVVKALIDPAQVERLKGLLVKFIEAGGKGCWALGKSLDGAMVPVYRRVLQRELENDAFELYQAMIALDNVGEDVFGGRASMSVNEEKVNQTLARAYLRRVEERERGS